MGPTGAGKTAASLALAKELSACVINADSRQVYQDFPIITAQPSAEEQAACPHLLYGFVPTQQKINAGEYARMAAATVTKQINANLQPLLVGGTGLYFQTLLEGISPIPSVAPNIAEYWQQECEKLGSVALYEKLTEIDPIYAAKIHPNDKQRVTRALEVWQGTGHIFSWWHKQKPEPSPYMPIKIGISLPLAQLEPILAKRIQVMLDLGAIDEAQNALAICNDPTSPGWSGIGCQELFAYLQGQLSLNAACDAWQKNTRSYAKRQITWFKRDNEIQWFAPWQTEEICRYVALQLQNR